MTGIKGARFDPRFVVQLPAVETAAAQPERELRMLAISRSAAAAEPIRLSLGVTCGVLNGLFVARVRHSLTYDYDCAGSSKIDDRPVHQTAEGGCSTCQA